MQQPVVHALQRGAIGAQRTHDAGDAAHSYGESITARKDVVRVGGAAPPAASRCSARTSLRAPSRGDPPLNGCVLACDTTFCSRGTSPVSELVPSVVNGVRPWWCALRFWLAFPPLVCPI